MHLLEVMSQATHIRFLVSKVCYLPQELNQKHQFAEHAVSLPASLRVSEPRSPLSNCAVGVNQVNTQDDVCRLDIVL